MHQGSARGRRQCQRHRGRRPIGEIYGGRLQRTGIANRQVSVARERYGAGIVGDGNYANLERTRLACRDVKWSAGHVQTEIGDNNRQKIAERSNLGVVVVPPVSTTALFPTFWPDR